METKKRKGYTLMEILVIVIIIGVLASLVAPQYNKVINRADVSDGLKNIDLFSAAENKYFIQKGVYTNDLSTLETPLKGNTANISAGNFIYSAGNPKEDNYCIYSENKTKNYTLARNYKENSEVICSGAGCSKIESMVKTGSLASLCGGEYNGDCDITCTLPKIKNDSPCGCICDSSKCLGTGIQDPGTCQCKCLGQSSWNEEQHTCTCSELVEDNCKLEGKEYDASSCDCVQPEQHCENTCNALQVQNPETCTCSCAESPAPVDGHFCELGNLTGSCECNCQYPSKQCKSGFTYDSGICGCRCEKTTDYCVNQYGSNYVLNEGSCNCEEKESCSDEQISSCSGSNQTLQEDCSCKCTKTLFCPVGQIYDKRQCICREVGVACALTEEECSSAGKVLNEEDCLCECPEGNEEKDCPNGHFDPGICDCACDLTDEICATYPGKRRIASTSPCQCVESSCPDDVAACYNGNGNGHYDYRECTCVCDLKDDYCKEKFGKRLNAATCECVSVVHE